MRFLAQVATLAAIALSVTAVGSTRSLAEDGYRITVIPTAPGAGIAIFRINVATGQVSYTSGSSYSNVQESEAIPAGAYRLYFAETPDNKTFWLYRMDTKTGRTWLDGNNTWTEVK